MSEFYSYDLVERLSFVRWGGTPEEKKAAEILKAEVEALGGTAELMPFNIPACTFKSYSVKVVAPYEKELEVLPYGCSGSLPEGGVDLKFYYAGRGVAEDYYGMDDLSDTVVMINELNYDAYKLLCKKKAAALLVIQNKVWDTHATADLVYRPMRPKFLENGKLPSFMVWASEATELVLNGAETLHLELQQDEFEAESQDVVAVIPGTGCPGESVVVTAHYDSVTVGTGSWDNATGSATIMNLYRHFLKNPPLRTMYFVWCGSEEQGLYGSKAYVEQHTEQVEKEIKFCFNFDMCGTVLGPNLMFVTGGDDLKHYAESFCREYGMSADIMVNVHSSDSAPFCDKGVPAVGLSRGSRTAEIHTRNDLINVLSPSQLEKDCEFAKAFMERVINSKRLPVGTGMPQSMKETIDKYFQRHLTSLAQDEEKAAKGKEEKK